MNRWRTFWNSFRFWVKLVQDSNVLWKRTTKTIENETKQKGEFLRMLLGTLWASLLGNMLTGKEILRASYGHKEEIAMLRAGYGSSIKKTFDFIPSSNKFWNTEVLSK